VKASYKRTLCRLSKGQVVKTWECRDKFPWVLASSREPRAVPWNTYAMAGVLTVPAVTRGMGPSITHTLTLYIRAK